MVTVPVTVKRIERWGGREDSSSIRYTMLEAELKTWHCHFAHGTIPIDRDVILADSQQVQVQDLALGRQYLNEGRTEPQGREGGNGNGDGNENGNGNRNVNGNGEPGEEKGKEPRNQLSASGEWA